MRQIIVAHRNIVRIIATADIFRTIIMFNKTPENVRQAMRKLEAPIPSKIILDVVVWLTIIILITSPTESKKYKMAIVNTPFLSDIQQQKELTIVILKLEFKQMFCYSIA
jgi:hypothetical protein